MGGVRQWPAPDSVASGGASMQSQNRNPKRFLKKQDLIKSGLLAAAAVFTCSAHAQDDSSWWDGVSFSLGGFIRPEVAVSTSSSDNFANQRGNIFNERSIARQAYVPPRLLAQIAGEPFGAPLGQVLSGLGIKIGKASCRESGCQYV